MNGVRNIAGTTLSGAGSLLDNPVSKTAAGIAGTVAGPSVGAGIGGTIGGAVGGPIGAGIGSVLGGIAGLFTGGKVAADTVGGAGKFLKETGDDIKYS